MKKIIFLIILILGISVSLFSTIIVNKTGPYYVGDSIGFNKDCHEGTNRDDSWWDWGDSSPTTMHTDDADYGWQYHTFTSPGTYTVTYTRGAPYSTPWCTSSPETYIITIQANRYLSASPSDPSVGQSITFRAHNYLYTSGIVWDMGDGTVLNINNPKNGVAGVTGGQVVQHTYSKSGTYTVRATEDTVYSTLSITVSEDRYITVSPSVPYAGQLLTFTAVNFLTPDSIKWDMGDGTILNINEPITKRGAKRLSGSTIQYTYKSPGNYNVRAYDENGSQTIPVSLSVGVAMPNRQIVYSPEINVRVDQPVFFGVTGFLTNIIDWNFGDGTVNPGASVTIMHRFQTSGTWTVTAKDSSIDHSPIPKQILILPENRELRLNMPEVRVNEPIQISALNFRGDLILWDFGDGKQESSGHSVSHIYERGGNYIIKARDENGESLKEFTATIIVRGITDEVHLEVAEIRLDNGKYYKVVPRNSKDLKAVLRMKMRGTGSVSGYWLVDGNPFEFFNELAVQGELKEIFTGTIPGLPTLEPGMHTVSVRLTKPSEVALNFPVLKYFVLPTETIMETISPNDGFVVKEKEIPLFSWKEPKGASKYQIGFSNYIYPILMNEKSVTWVDIGSKLSYRPSKTVWDKIKRNKWTHWKIRAYDTNKQFIAESEIQDIKVVIATAEISLNSITDLEGNKIKVSNGIIRSDKKNLLVGGDITYKGNSKFIVLRVYSGEEMIDQLLFRDVKKNETRSFETSIPNMKNDTKIKFEVLKTSSPSVIIGIKGLILRKK